MGLDNPLHIAVLILLLLLLFGAKRLPELGRSLGTGMREFKEGITGSHAPPASPPIETHPEAEPVREPVASQASAPDADL
jgi:sec-independent protein translocase protein TatA